MNFTDSEFNALKKDLHDVMTEICEKYQIKLKSTRINYGPVEFDMKLTFQKNEEGLDVEQINFSMDCFRYGFKPSDYKRTFEHLGIKYEFVGFDTSAKKYNCIVKDVKTGITSKVNSLILEEIFKSDELRENSYAEEEYVECPPIGKDDISLLNIKLAKGKRNEKDWKWIRELFPGKEVYTFKVNKPNAFVGTYRQIAEEDEMLSIFTSVESCVHHLDELNENGIISGKTPVVSLAYDDVINIAEHEKINVIIDNSCELNKGYLVYSSENHNLKVIIKAEK